VIALDTNLLIYAHRGGAPEHAAARRVIQTLAAAGTPWGFALATVSEFWSLVTHPRYPGGASRARDLRSALCAGPVN
jgi:hypothetical protein